MGVGPRHPRRQLGGRTHGAVPHSVPTPVELGFRVHRDRLGASSSRPCLVGADQPVPRPVARRRVPHIVFNPAVSGGAYFPGPGFWSSATVEGTPSVATSGLVQPPVHALAAWHAYRRVPTQEGRSALRRLYPHLVAQQRYLASCRDVGGAGLASIVHPWESGLDNSPAWDEPMSAVAAEAAVMRAYRRATPCTPIPPTDPPTWTTRGTSPSSPRTARTVTATTAWPTGIRSWWNVHCSTRPWVPRSRRSPGSPR